MILRRAFYARPSTVVARELIGKVLVRKLDGKNPLKGVIVETEAYGGLRDPASHAYAGMTPRTEVMFGEAGFSYVYFTYGFYHCINVVTGKKGRAQAVLLRALEPKQGIETMKRLRGTDELFNLTSGPGKICQAFAIDRTLSKLDITKSDSPIYLESESKAKTERRVRRSTRIGISEAQERLWRFYDPASPFVSHQPQSKLNLANLK